MVKILIDMQGCQTPGSRSRGIGRYADALVHAMARNAGEDEIHLLLSPAFPETLAPIINRFSPVVPDGNIHIAPLLHACDDRSPANRWRKDATALLREAYIESLYIDVVFCPSFFEGYIDDFVMSVGRFGDAPVAATLHDLIPLMNPEEYLTPHPDFDRHYRAKVEEFRRCAGVIAISESSAQEAVELAGFDAARVVNASEAAEADFRDLGLDEAQREALMTRLGIDKPFVFYTGGADPRKNLARLIAAFAALPKATREAHRLVFAGKIPVQQLSGLKAAMRSHGVASHEVIFLGYVSDEDLVALYNLARVFVFPSLHEGFGLPALEAMQCGTPVLAANKTSLPEVVGLEEALFDPLDVAEMSRKMARVLDDQDYHDMLVRHGHEQAAKFSWEHSAELTLEALRQWARPATPPTNWIQVQHEFDERDERLIAALSALQTQHGRPAQTDLLNASRAMMRNRVEALSRLRHCAPGGALNWRLEGPMDSSYSLALVNRELARALDAAGHDVSLHSCDGPGDITPDAGFLAANPDIAAFYERARRGSEEQADIVSRNLYPPRVHDMGGRINALHNYAWEETGFPGTFALDFNEHLQFMTVTSRHVKKLLIDNGVSVPMTVSGNGVDHLTTIETDPDYQAPKAGYVFLHVSSCFPRKGADVLLEAYGRAFRKGDDVVLVIKTFANPHNTIEAQLEKLRAENPDYPDVTVIVDELTPGQMKALYAQCDIVVVPSRAEGFGLPVAEAILAGKRVIATGWSGQMDFCTPDNTDFIDFSFALAETHLADVYDSVWAEPDAAHLAILMSRARERKLAGKVVAPDAAPLLEAFGWQKVAERNVEAARKFAATSAPQPRIGWVSTYNKRCGIATYSEHLIEVLGLPLTVLAAHTSAPLRRDPENVIRCWKEGEPDDLSDLLAQIERLDLNIVVIQFNYGFYDLDALAALMEKLVDQGRKVIVTMHATIDPPQSPERRMARVAHALSRCARVLVHSINDMNRLKKLGVSDNLTLFSHGIRLLKGSGDAVALAGGAGNRPILVASYGFFFPDKGLHELIDAIHYLRSKGLDYRLRMVNAQHDSDVSRQQVEQAKNLVHQRRIAPYVEFHTDFLSDEDSMALIRDADVLVYAYQRTGESASGAVRYGIASGRPVAVAPSSIFDDVADIVFRLPGKTPGDIAAGLEDLVAKLAQRDEATMARLDRATAWRNAHSYPVLGRRLAGLLTGLLND